VPHPRHYRPDPCPDPITHQGSDKRSDQGSDKRPDQGSNTFAIKGPDKVAHPFSDEATRPSPDAHLPSGREEVHVKPEVLPAVGDDVRRTGWCGVESLQGVQGPTGRLRPDQRVLRGPAVHESPVPMNATVRRRGS
jgi:hypothetical protein